MGNLGERAEARGKFYQLEYIKKGQPGRILQPDGSVMTLSYDGRGNIVSLLDA